MSANDFIEDSVLITGLSEKIRLFFEDNDKAIKIMFEEACRYDNARLHVEIVRGEIREVLLQRSLSV